MPIYEFTCNACGADFEVLFRSMTERRRPTCTACDSRDIRKRFSTFAMGGVERRGGGAGGSSGCATCAGGSCATCRP